jgi:hypothetical protein
MIYINNRYTRVFKNLLDASNKTKDRIKDAIRDINGQPNNNLDYYLTEEEYNEISKKYRDNFIKYLLARRKYINMSGQEKQNIDEVAKEKNMSPEEYCMELVEQDLLQEKVERCNKLYKLIYGGKKSTTFIENFISGIFEKKPTDQDLKQIEKVCSAELLVGESALLLFKAGAPIWLIPSIIKSFHHSRYEYFINNIPIKRYCNKNNIPYENIELYLDNREKCIETIQRTTGTKYVQSEMMHFIFEDEVKKTFKFLYMAYKREKSEITEEDLRPVKKVMTSATNPQ